MSRLVSAYRVLAFVVGILLAFGSLVALPLKYLLTDGSTLQQFGENASIVWLFHGWIYIVYVVVTFLLSRRAGLDDPVHDPGAGRGPDPAADLLGRAPGDAEAQGREPRAARGGTLPSVTTAFVLGGGGVLGAVEVGMLRALFERDIAPGPGARHQHRRVQRRPGRPPARPRRGRAAHRAVAVGEQRPRGGVRRPAAAHGPPRGRVGHPLCGPPSRCGSGWRTSSATSPSRSCRSPSRSARPASSGRRSTGSRSGRVVDAVVASAAVPGLLPPAKVGDEHFLDGGIVNSVPLGRAVELGATRVFVLQVGRLDRPLKPPKRPWEVARVSFEIARRHRFVRELAELPD